jgi:copper chaperone CopZ
VKIGGSDGDNNDNENSTAKEVTAMANTAKKTIEIEGMMCSHCTGTVSKVLNAIDGVSAEVSLDDKCAYVTVSGDVSDETLKSAVTGAGYEVVAIKNS